MSSFENIEYWKAITLLGLNVTTYKPALAKNILLFAKMGNSNINWNDFSNQFLNLYITHLNETDFPQHSTKGKLSKIENITKKLKLNLIDHDKAVQLVAEEGLNDVVPRFHTIGLDSKFAKDYFYEFDFGKNIILKDTMFEIVENHENELFKEVESRWKLVESAFKINHSNYDFQLANSLRDIYIKNGYNRKDITNNIDFLNPYQGNVCFYCGEKMTSMHVDHVIPRQIINNDQIWNLVIAHPECNMLKSDLLVAPHFIQKLIIRNENIMGSSHPWKYKISQQLGISSKKRKDNVLMHYENAKIIRGNVFWGGTKNYNPEKDQLYRKLITKINEKKLN